MQVRTLEDFKLSSVEKAVGFRHRRAGNGNGDTMRSHGGLGRGGLRRLSTYAHLFPHRAPFKKSSTCYIRCSMADRFEKRTEEFLESILGRKACALCRNRDKKIHLNGLCRSCYNVRARLRKLHKQVVAADARYTKAQWMRNNQLFVLEMEYMLAIAMADSAQVLGEGYERLLKDADTLQCEWEFRHLSRRFVKKDLFDHHAFFFEAFSPAHRRFLMYLISRPMLEFYSRNRRNMAYGQIMSKTREEVLKERGWGTYRVEDDPAVKPRVRKPKSRAQKPRP